VAYDTVKFDCPHCNRETTEQVGAVGTYRIYSLASAPEEVIERLIDPIRQVNCEHCNGRVVFGTKVTVETVVEKWVDDAATEEEVERGEMWRVLRSMGVNTNMTLEEAMRTPGLKFLIDPQV
jgi:DNA-directed RNA polymerase subunit RPC12/RpoP